MTFKRDYYFNKLDDFLSRREYESIYNSFFNCYSEIEHLVKKDDKILDVGCGIGLLVNHFKEESYNIIGIDNHIYNEKYKKIYHTLNINGSIKLINFENYDTSNKFDLIICHNTIEHFEDWKKMLSKLINHLHLNGRLIIMAPNYNMPFDVHLMIPLIINKKLTHKIFKKKIYNYENLNNKQGIWNSLNFIKFTELIYFIKKSEKNLKIEVDKNYFGRIIVKLITNSKNKKSRHAKSFFYKFMVFVSVLLLKIKIINFYKHLPIRFHPFAKVIIHKNEAN